MPEPLKLDNQMSLKSEGLNSGENAGVNPEMVSPNVQQTLLPQPVYDYEEGVKRHIKKIYSEIIDIVTTIPEQAEEDKFFQAEELKSYHKSQLLFWKAIQMQKNIRGSGAGSSTNRALSGHVLQGGMYGGMPQRDSYQQQSWRPQQGQHPMPAGGNAPGFPQRDGGN